MPRPPASSSATTALCYDGGAEVVNEGTTDTAFYNSFFCFTQHHQPFPEEADTDEQRRLISALVTNPSARISQSTMTADDIARLLTYKELGRGSFGAAYVCRIGGGATANRWVIKLPNPLLLEPVPQQVETARQANVGVPVARLLMRPDAQPDYAQRHANALEDFRIEFENAEGLLEPACMAQYRALTVATHYPDLAGETDPVRQRYRLIGRPLVTMRPVAYFEYVYALSKLRMEPGYAHLHRVVHLDETIPALISEAAAGSLRGLQEGVLRGAYNIDLLSLEEHAWGGVTLYTPSPLWVQIARQMTAAIDYMQSHTLLTHVDLKPENVLYKQGANLTIPAGHIHCLISDYGLCCLKDELFPRQAHPPFPFMDGTQLYNPPNPPRDPTLIARWFTGAIPKRAQTQFQLFVTLADLLYFPGAPIDPANLDPHQPPPGGFLSEYFEVHAQHNTIADVFHAYTSTPDSIHAAVMRSSHIRPSDPGFETLRWDTLGSGGGALLHTFLSPLIQPTPIRLQQRFRLFRTQTDNCYAVLGAARHLRSAEEARLSRDERYNTRALENLHQCERAEHRPATRARTHRAPVII